MHNEDMNPAENIPATKADFAPIMAILMDLRAGLAQCATKDELKGFATKEDLASGFGEIAERIGTLEAVVRRIAMDQTRLRAEVNDQIDALRLEVRGFFSRTVGQVDGFMSTTMKVDRGQIILVHRVDRLEERMSRFDGRPS